MQASGVRRGRRRWHTTARRRVWERLAQDQETFTQRTRRGQPIVDLLAADRRVGGRPEAGQSPVRLSFVS